VVIQNRRGLDLFTAEKRGLCLFLNEECWFYVTQLGQLIKYHQIPWLSPVTGAMQAQPWEETSCLFHSGLQDLLANQRNLANAGFCRIWIPNYSLLAKSLNEATKVGEWEQLVWGEKQGKAFREIKRALTNAPSLGLLNVMKPFFLYVHEWKGAAVGVLIQLLCSWHCPVAYFLKQLNAISQGWPPCLHALALSGFPTPSCLSWNIREIIGWPTFRWSNTRVCYVKTHTFS
jgi:hypothetical protein